MGGAILPSLLCCLTMALANCKKPANETVAHSLAVASPASPDPTRSVPLEHVTKEQPPDAFDASALITKEEIEAIQGSVVQETKSSASSSEGLRMSQCFYTTAEFSKSVSLAVTQSDSSNPAVRSNFRQLCFAF